MADTATIDTDNAALSTAAEVTPAQEASRKNLRKRMLLIFGTGVCIAALSWGAYEYFIGSRYVSTDDAYVAAYSAVLTPQTSGAVAEVHVRDAQAVHRGEILVILDDADARLTLASAEAGLKQARDKAQQDRANVDAATAKVAFCEADIVRNEALVASAQSALDRARSEYQRRQKVERSGAVSAEDLVAAKATYDAAEASLQAATAALDQARATKAAALGEKAAAEALAGTAGIDGNAGVLAAQAIVNTARLNLERTVIRAPIDGIVARRRVQVGERVALGSELLTIVPVDQAYVEANFKETQLRKIRIGQSVTLTADRYGSSVVYHGSVAGLEGGTGSAFAVIPAQNATGNWIKVAQRLPVHITLEPKELLKHPLRVGLSMEATVDVSDPRAEKIAGAD
jgi:membrane fusion protein (multidrug efflux system)